MKSYAQMSAVPRTEEYIGTGDGAIYRTVDKMKSIIIESSKNTYVREWAKKIVARVEVNNKKAEAKAVFNFVRDCVRYTRDPLGFEYLQTPPTLLEDIRLYQDGKGDRPVGDCDDMTLLSLSLLKSIGFQVAIKVVGFSKDKKYSHVYGLVKIGSEWVPIDCVRPDQELGWESQGHTRVMETII
jgi:transglutaminase-like putative cysteine protease